MHNASNRLTIELETKPGNTIYTFRSVPRFLTLWATLSSNCNDSAKRSGLDLTAFWHAIRASAGNSFTWETAAPNVFAGDYHKFFDMGLQTKDIQLMADIAKASNVSDTLSWNGL